MNNKVKPVLHSVSKKNRSSIKNQIPFCLWITGLPSSGKSTIACALEEKLFENYLHTYHLDGDNLRYKLNKDLNFNKEDRDENIRRISEIAYLFNEAGIITIVSVISPLKSQKELARNIIGENFIEVYLTTPLDVCIERDPKGHYKKAIRGDISNYTGISSPYNESDSPEIKIDTSKKTIRDCVTDILEYCSRNNLINIRR